MKIKKKRIVTVIGPSESICPPEVFDFGVELGRCIIDQGYFLACGGMGGIMEAVCKGARESKKYQLGCTIGIIPYSEKEKANEYCDIIVPTGIGLARNQIVVNTGDIIVAVHGGAGTLSEIALAWPKNKKVICYAGFGGWSEKLAGIDLDIRYKGLLLKANS
ncbi:TIGR00725 family protein, partial [Candidatus Amoebophilus asiaticus]|nr:TIGR00725 family protein [Candidatus Amoebophilus asiaticus]